MTDELLKQYNDLKVEINKANADLERAKIGLESLKLENKTARAGLRVMVPSDRNVGFDPRPDIFPTSEFLLEYIKRLENYIAILNAEFLAL